MNNGMVQGFNLGIAMSDNDNNCAANDNIVHTSSTGISITEPTAIAITEWTAGIMFSGLALLFLWGCCRTAYDEFRQRKSLKNAYKRED